MVTRFVPVDHDTLCTFRRENRDLLTEKLS